MITSFVNCLAALSLGIIIIIIIIITIITIIISVGCCPYRDRCVYLHDSRVALRDAKSKTRKKNKEDIIQDSLFWPVMPEDSVRSKLDNRNQPAVNQEYQVTLLLLLLLYLLIFYLLGSNTLL